MGEYLQFNKCQMRIKGRRKEKTINRFYERAGKAYKLDQKRGNRKKMEKNFKMTGWAKGV